MQCVGELQVERIVGFYNTMEACAVDAADTTKCTTNIFSYHGPSEGCYCCIMTNSGWTEAEEWNIYHAGTRPEINCNTRFL